MVAFTAKKLVTMLEIVPTEKTEMIVVRLTKVGMATEKEIIGMIIIIATIIGMEEAEVRVGLVEEGVHTQGLGRTLLASGTMVEGI